MLTISAYFGNYGSARWGRGRTGGAAKGGERRRKAGVSERSTQWARRISRGGAGGVAAHLAVLENDERTVDLLDRPVIQPRLHGVVRRRRRHVQLEQLGITQLRRHSPDGLPRCVDYVETSS